MTDGNTVIVTKYVDMEDCECASLYFSSGTFRIILLDKLGNRFVCNTKTEYRMLKTEKRNEAVIITSEPLTDNPSDWVVRSSDNRFLCYSLCPKTIL